MKIKLVGNMINYHKEEMIYDCKPKDVMVFDVNSLLLFDIDRVARRVKIEFPEVVKLLKIKAVNDQLYPGDAIVIKVRGYTIVSLVTQVNLYGNNKDDNETINMFTINAINEMLSKVNKGSHFISGILNRRNGTWNRVAYHIAQKKLNWSIFTE